MVREILPSDADAICEIYNYYIENTIITFEEDLVSESDMKDRIQTSKLPWLVYEEDNNIQGYAFASGWKSRCAYKYSVECSVYLNQKYEG